MVIYISTYIHYNLFIYKLIKLGQRPTTKYSLVVLPFTQTLQQGEKQLVCCSVLHFSNFLCSKDHSLSDFRVLCHASYRLQSNVLSGLPMTLFAVNFMSITEDNSFERFTCQNHLRQCVRSSTVASQTNAIWSANPLFY